MKIRVRALRTLINEELAAQAPPDAPMGQFAWPQQRKLDVDEPDTTYEEQLFKKLEAAVGDTAQKLPSSDVVALQRMLNNGYYKEVIHGPDPSVTLYRGLCVKQDYIDSLGVDSDHGALKKNFTFKQRGDYSSWTKDIATAYNFSYPSRDDEFGVIFVANPADNAGRMIDMAPFYSMESNISLSAEESEVMIIGNVKVETVVWFSREVMLKGDNSFYDKLNF